MDEFEQQIGFLRRTLNWNITWITWDDLAARVGHGGERNVSLDVPYVGNLMNAMRTGVEMLEKSPAPIRPPPVAVYLFSACAFLFVARCVLVACSRRRTLRRFGHAKRL